MPLFANPTLFSKYEATRQGLLKNSLADAKKSATDLAAAATDAQQRIVAQHAKAIAGSKNIAKAREHFGFLSRAMLDVHAGAAKDARPAVYSCPMVKKSWLQAKGKVGNPYDPAMAMCGVLEKE